MWTTTGRALCARVALLWILSGLPDSSASTGPAVTVKLRGHGSSDTTMVSMGEVVIFACEMHGSPLPIFSSWTKEGGGKLESSNDGRIAIDQQVHDLWIGPLQKSDSGRYFCHAKVGHGDINGSLTLTVKSGPNIISQTYTTREFSNITLECGGNDVSSVLWKFKGKILQNQNHSPYRIRGRQNQFLDIFKVRREHGGTYECSADDGYYDERFTGNQTLIIKYPPQFESLWDKYLAIEEGDNVTVNCSAVGFPEPVFIWQRNGELLGSAGSTYEVVTTKGSSVLSVFNITRNNTILTCSARNELRLVSVSIRLIVAPSKGSTRCRIKFSQKTVVRAAAGKAVKIRCFDQAKAGRHALDSVEWKKNGRTLDFSTERIRTLKEWLMIFNASKRDAGNFSCHVQTDDCEIVHSISLHVYVSGTPTPTPTPTPKTPAPAEEDDPDVPLWIMILAIFLVSVCLFLIIVGLRRVGKYRRDRHG